MRRGQKTGMRPFTVGLLTLLVAGALTYLGFTKEVPFRHHYTLKAVFPSANNLRVNSPVRIAGVNVGKVTSVHAVHDGEQAAVVEMRIDKKGLPIHKDARMAIRPRIFLEGNFFVDIDPGSPSAPTVSDGDTLPVNQNRAPVQLDQILTTLQSDTRKDLQRLLQSFSRGLSGKGAAGYNASIPYWRSAYRDSAIVNDASLGLVDHDLSGYLKNAGATAQALDADAPKLRSLITNFNSAAAAFAARDGALERAVAELPRTLAAAQPALAKLNGSFPAVRRFVADLRPGVRASGPAVRASTPLVRQLRALVQDSELRGLVRDLRPTVPALTRLDAESVPLFEQTRQASSCQNEVILPWSHKTLQDPVFPATGPVYQDSLKVLPGIAGESRSGDANGQWFRVMVTGGLYSYPTGGDTLMLTGQPLLGSLPPKPSHRPLLNSKVPCETQEQADLRAISLPVAGGRKASVPASKQAELTKLRDRAVAWVNKQIKTEGLTGQLRAITSPATDKTLDALKALKAKALRETKR